MTVNEQNIVKRWNFMASKNLGTDRNIEAYGFADLFTAVFEGEQYQVHTDRCINRIIRGFVINEMLEDECSVTECLDLCHVDITNYAAQQLDWYLMNRLGWFERYQYSLNLE